MRWDSIAEKGSALPIQGCLPPVPQPGREGVVTRYQSIVKPRIRYGVRMFRNRINRTWIFGA